MANTGYEKFKENRAVSGVGSGLYVKDAKDGKYCLALLLETVPSVSGSFNTIEVEVTGSDVIGKIIGKETIDDKDVNFLLHRDSVIRLEELVDQSQDFMIVTQDLLGFQFSGMIKYKPNDLTSGETAKGTITITATSIEKTPVINALPLLKKTVKFESAIPAQISMSTNEKSRAIDVKLDPSSATIDVVSDNDALAGTYSMGKLTLNATSAEGSAVVRLKASAPSCASWTTTILVTFDGK